jgi:hypothetical protein
MSEKKVVVRSGGIGFCGLLTLLFIALKLTGYINWSWLWVLSPIWLPPAVIFGGIGLFMVFCLLMAGVCQALIYLLERR